MDTRITVEYNPQKRRLLLIARRASDIRLLERLGSWPAVRKTAYGIEKKGSIKTEATIEIQFGGEPNARD